MAPKQTPDAITKIEDLVFNIRKQRVMLDYDLAVLYGTTTKRLNQAVARNSDRFPEDYMFRLTNKEKMEVVTKCDRLVNLKYSPNPPFAFNEYGALMLATVLNSEQAILMSHHIVKVFVKARRMTTSLHILKLIKHGTLKATSNQIKSLLDSQDKTIQDIIDMLDKLEEV